MTPRLLSVRAWLLGALLALRVLTAGTLLWMSRPLGSHDLVCHPHPAAGYDEALARFEAHQARQAGRRPAGLPFAPLRPRAADRARVVLLHGFTGAAAVLRPSPSALRARRERVLVLRVPHHGARPARAIPNGSPPRSSGPGGRGGRYRARRDVSHRRALDGRQRGRLAGRSVRRGRAVLIAPLFGVRRCGGK